LAARASLTFTQNLRARASTEQNTQRGDERKLLASRQNE
jgi:hypothetical protein